MSRCRRSARVVPAAAGYALHPDVRRQGERPGRSPGPRSRRAVRGRERPRPGDGRCRRRRTWRCAAGCDLERLNLAPILKDPAQRSDLTGHATVDLKMASEPATAPVVDRIERHVCVRRAARRRAGIRREERDASRVAGRTADHARRPRRGVRRDRDGARLHRDAGARARRWRSIWPAAPSTSTCGSSRRRPACRSWRHDLSVADYHVSGTGAVDQRNGDVSTSPTSKGRTHRRRHDGEVRPDAVERSAYTARGSGRQPRPASPRRRAEDRGAGEAGVRQPHQRQRSTWRAACRATPASRRREQARPRRRPRR